jgi:hypothetical protein
MKVVVHDLLDCLGISSIGHIHVVDLSYYYKKTKIMAETTAQNVNNMASYADAAKQHTIFRDCPR